MSHTLPLLPFKENALEPYISKKTIEFHYGKHHQTYITNLNNLIPGTKFEGSTLEEIVKHSDGALFNNSAQVWNHTFYFQQLSGKPNKTPSEKLAKVINGEFESLEGFMEKFNHAALSLFGSGWIWVVKKHDSSLQIIPESNAGNPILLGLTPVMVIDVWEHAYYLDYQNRRADYIKNFWHVLNWDVVSKRFEESNV